MRATSRHLSIVACLLLSGPAGAEDPMSAIDWLSKSVTSPSALPRGSAVVARPNPDEPPVTRGAAARPITTTTLDQINLDTLGLVPAAKSGLPHELWGPAPAAGIAAAIHGAATDTVPAIQSLLATLMIAETAPPQGPDAQGTVFLARVDKLLDMGALDPALELLNLPATPRPEVFRRWFDVALLLGEEDHACAQMRKTPQIAPTFPARIFCLARGGDWNAAALSLRTGEALGQIDPEMATLLSRFLDPEIYEGEPPLPPPARMSPLILRLMEAIGEPQPTATLPVAFANADLRPSTGWKSRIEAGERLARTGALDPNVLLGLYTEQHPAASGGVWDRVRAWQEFDAALTDGDANEIALTLPVVWDRLSAVELEVPFATLYGERLAAMKLPGEAGEIAFRVGLLSPAYAVIAHGHVPDGAEDRFLAGLAQGRPAAPTPNQLGTAILQGFSAEAEVSDDLAGLLKEGRLGEAILRAADDVTNGARGDLRTVTSGLALLRKIGLEQTARRAAMELMLLERRG